jgi:GTPase SAR1 family protein
VIVYSIADRGSFRTAHEALISLRGNGIQRSLDKHTTAASDHVPIVLLGNKKDLDHLREVRLNIF